MKKNNIKNYTSEQWKEMINKLTELIKEAMQYADNRKDIGELHKPFEEYIAEYLVENGVSVSED